MNKIGSSRSSPWSEIMTRRKISEDRGTKLRANLEDVSILTRSIKIHRLTNNDLIVVQRFCLLDSPNSITQIKTLNELA